MEIEHRKGLILVEPVEGDYVQGGRVQLGGLSIMPSGQWDAFLIPDEMQDKGISTMACTSFNTLKPVEMLEKQEFGDNTEWSDRFLAEISGTTPAGNDPHRVGETLRLKGTVYDSDWPYGADIDTFGKFYQTPPYDLYTQAQAKFRGTYDFAHQFVKTNPQAMVDALQFSPLGVDVFAWNSPDSDGIYHREGRTSEHWTTIYGYEVGKYWKCSDSYAPFQKKLAWDFGFSLVKQYTLHKQVITNSIFKVGQAKAINWFRAIFGLPPIT